MGINLTEISQKVLDTVSNASNVFRKMYDLHYNPNPIDVPMEYIDENGQKRTTQVPNVAKFRKRVWDDVGGALGQFDRTFYVDQQNGDDNNEGTSSEPFASFHKAIMATPTGGAAKIYLANDYIFDETHAPIDIVGKNITIVFNGHQIKVFPYTQRPDGHVQYARLYVQNSTLSFYMNGTANLTLEENNTGKPIIYAGFVLTTGYYPRGVNAFNIYATGQDDQEIITIKANGLFGHYGAMPITYFSHLSLDGYRQNGKNIIKLYPNTSLYTIGDGCGSFSHKPGYIECVDQDGNHLDIKNYIAGVVRDSNGLPRNLITNVIL